MVSNILSYSIKMDNSIRLSKINFTTLKILLFLIFFSFFSFISKPFLNPFQKYSKLLWSFRSTPFITINKMQQHVCSHMLLPYDVFKFNENFYFIIFHVHKNCNLNHFNSISKEANFRVLQFYPP